MKYENTVEIGSVVKSLDFPSTTAFYYVGIVVGINEMEGTFRAKTIKRVWDGKTDSTKIPPEFFEAPLPGSHMFDSDWCESRIQVVA